MFFLLGPLAVVALFGALEVASRLFGLSFSILGALGAVLRQTDEPRLQRRQALTLVLLVAGLFAFGFGVFYLVAGILSQAIFITTMSGAVLLTLAGYIGNRTRRAIARSAVRDSDKAKPHP